MDNAKMLLVALVVVGHSWADIRDSALATSAYDFLYLFHIPAFVMVTGYLSRSFSYSRRHLLATEWLYWRSSYAELGVSAVEGMALRLGLLVVGVVLALSVLALVPRSVRWFTRLGAASLVVDLGHGFAIKSVMYAGAPALADDYPIWIFLAVTGLALVVTVTLALPPVARRLNVIVDPVGELSRSTAERRRSEADSR